MKNKTIEQYILNESKYFVFILVDYIKATFSWK